MKALLSDSFVQRLQRTAERRYEVWDSQCQGLVLTVSASGVKSYSVRFRVDGRSVRVTLGRSPAVKARAARKRAFALLAKATEGIDPRYEPKRRNNSLLFDEAVERFFAVRRVKASTRDESLRRFNAKLLPIFGKRPFSSITREEVRTLISGIEQRGATTVARHTLLDLCALYKWAVYEDLIEAAHSPTLGIRKPAVADPRDRVLNREELARIWRATASLSRFHTLVRLLILTAQRRGEVANATWAQFDMDGATWTLPRRTTKNGSVHSVPLSSLAVETLRAWQMHDFAFCGWSQSKERLDKQACVTSWRLHDIRRTVATELAALGVAPHVVERILNHSSGTISGVAAIYNRYRYLPEMRDALEAWASLVRTL